MNNARSRKTRSSSARGGRGKGVERQIPADGVYTNHRFMQSVGALVGLPVLIQTKTKEIIEGVFTTFSPNFDLVLDMAHPVARPDTSIINPETIKRKMIFSSADIVTIKVNNVDLEYATKDGFAVDQVISRFNGQVTERPLEPWQGDANAEDSLALGDESSNGWDVDDMFRKNEEKYGVTTSYTPEMEGYTTPLNRRNTREYREREAKAQRIAAEIMSAPSTQIRSEAENGDEEDKFSAVIRPADQAASGGGGGATKYVPPMLRKKNQNSGKLMRSTPPPGPGSRYSGSNPTTPTSPSCAGPPQVSSGSHSPIGGPSGPGGASPGYPPQQGPPPTHSPSPAAHPPLHRHNSHSHPSDSKVNGDAKGAYDRRNHDGPLNDPGRENHHNDTGSKQDHHSRQHHNDGPPQKGQQKPSQHQHQASQHTGHMPPMGQGDHRKQEPREQREPRKPRTNKEEQIADLKKFSENFKLSEQAEKKESQQQQHPPTPQQLQQQQHPQEPQQQPPVPQQQPQQPPPSQQQQHQQHTQQPPPQPRQQPPPQPQQQPPQPQQQQQQQPQQPPPPPQSQPQQPPPQPQQQPPPPQQPQPPQPQPPPQAHMPPQPPPQQRQTPPVSTPIPQGPPQSVAQSAHHPQNPAAMTMSPVTEVSKAHEEADKMSSTVTNSKLNPNAKEFVFNPNAKPFSPRSPSTTTPPRAHTPQTPQIPSNQPPQMSGGAHSVGFQQAMVSAAYVMASPPFPVQPQPPRYPKRVPIGSNQRPEYTSQMQVAAATGQPILAPAPMNTQPQAITAVQIPQNILPQTPPAYQQYPSMPMMLRFPHAGMQMVTAMVPTSMGLYNQATDSQQQSQQHGHQTMYMAPTNLPPHQPHPAHTPGPGPQPTQPPTPQNPGGGGGPPTMPNQPPTPGPTPPQPLIYPHIGGQPSLPQHLPQHSPHTAQSPHTHQYPGQNVASAAAAAAAAGGHHGGPGQQMAAQIVMLPPNMAACPHMMHPSGPPPHSATAHIPSSMAGGFTPTSSAGVQHMASAPHIQYLQSTYGHHHVSIVRHS